MASSPLRRRALVAFADPLLAARLPQLDSSQRAETVEFVVDRWDRMSQPAALGIGIVGLAIFPLIRLASHHDLSPARRVAGALARSGAPLVQEFADFVLAVAVAYSFEQWPPDGLNSRSATR